MIAVYPRSLEHTCYLIELCVFLRVTVTFFSQAYEAADSRNDRALCCCGHRRCSPCGAHTHLEMENDRHGPGAGTRSIF